MIKQPTPLEALGNIINHLDLDVLLGGDYRHYKRDIKIVKNTLKDNEKKLKAFEIIMQLGKPKVFELQGQWYISNGDVFIHSHNIPITKEQAQLLLEVLECQKQ